MQEKKPGNPIKMDINWTISIIDVLSIEEQKTRQGSIKKLVVTQECSHQAANPVEAFSSGSSPMNSQ